MKKEEQETIEKVKICLQNFNALLQECRDQNISLQLEVDYKNTGIKDMLYCHNENNVTFELHEAYQILKYK